LKNYELHWTRKAFKFFEKLDRNTQNRIKKSLKELLSFYSSETAIKFDIKMLKGKYKGLFRLRVGDYRILFKIERKQLVILVVEIVSRENAYKKNQ